MPKIICVRPMADSPRLTHGLRMTGCGASSASSPRCAASCCTHHWQTFLPKVKPESWRPHRMQFAMVSISAYQELGARSEEREINRGRIQLRGFASANLVHRLATAQTPRQLRSLERREFQARRYRPRCADGPEPACRSASPSEAASKNGA